MSEFKLPGSVLPDDEQKAEGITSLHLSVFIYDMATFKEPKDYTGEELMRAVIAQTEDINVRDNNGQTALHQAAFFQIPGAVRILLEAGAEVDPLDNNGETPLFRCVSRTPSKEIVDLLLNAGADPYIKGRYGRTIPEYIKEIPTRERVDAFRQYFTDEEIRGVEEGIAEQDLLTEQLHELRRKSKQKKS